MNNANNAAATVPAAFLIAVARAHAAPNPFVGDAPAKAPPPAPGPDVDFFALLGIPR